MKIRTTESILAKRNNLGALICCYNCNKDFRSKPNKVGQDIYICPNCKKENSTNHGGHI